MCGLTGFWDFSARFPNEQLNNIVIKMVQSIIYRGPDDSAVWTSEKLGLAMGHCRLSIQDLTVAGKQPMHSNTGRFVVVYNGEIYNAPILQTELIKLGHPFKGHSDTEVIVQAFEEWGIESSCKKFIGMFAIVVWDNKLEELILIKDRLGVKPLYFGIIANVLFFGSQLKSFKPHPLWCNDLNKEAVYKYIKLNYVPTPFSIFKNIYKLEPATILTINKQQKINKSSYWNLEKIIANREIFVSDNSTIDLFYNLLKDAVKIRMMADVPIGAFLSGGIDSSLVVALMQEESNSKVKTFTIGFNEKNYNEAEFAKQVAEHLGTNHQELILNSKQALEIIPKLPEIYDEPFADSSQLPTLLVSKLAREQVTVILSGDGGDELFAGYNRYYLWNNIFNKIAWVPVKLRKIIAQGIYNISLNKWNLINKAVNIPNLGDKLYKLANILSFNNPQDFYTKVVSFWGNDTPTLYGGQADFINPNVVGVKDFVNFIEQMQFIDLNNYLPDDILTKVDRASMAYSLEARGPFLDHRVVEFSWKLPMNFKICRNEQKWILKKILAKYLPKKLINRRKMGFGVPIDSWLRKDLREWALNLLDPNKLKEQGLFNSEIICNKLQNHLSGIRNYQYDLWGILMFQAWYDNNF